MKDHHKITGPATDDYSRSLFIIFRIAKWLPSVVSFNGFNNLAAVYFIVPRDIHTQQS